MCGHLHRNCLNGRSVDGHHEAGTYSVKVQTPVDAPELFASIKTGRYRQWTKFKLVPD